jgi:hypothetical protein
MPELIERGYIYIAQPPLYGVRHGSSVVYIKNNDALNEYIAEIAMNKASATVNYEDGSSEVISGISLKLFLEKAVQFSNFCKNTRSYIHNSNLVEKVLMSVDNYDSIQPVNFIASDTADMIDVAVDDHAFEENGNDASNNDSNMSSMAESNPAPVDYARLSHQKLKNFFDHGEKTLWNLNEVDNGIFLSKKENGVEYKNKISHDLVKY